jgi:lysophospholipase L1-like esterase
VVYDTLGVNGGTFEHVLAWDEQLLRAQVAMREPALLVIMYGTNEASDRKLAPEAFAQSATEAIKRLRRGAPMAACLVIGPPDRRSTVRRRISTERLDWVISVEEGVAKAQGCEFIDARSLMGGPGSFATWQKQGLAAPDGVHLTLKGYTLLGRRIAHQMTRGFPGVASYAGSSR